MNKRSKIILLLSGVILITVICYAPSINNDFTNWDDPRYLLDNKMVQTLEKENVHAIFFDQSKYESSFVPLTILSFAIEYNFANYNAKVYHITNLILHLLNTMLVFWLIWLLCRKDEVAFITSILFALHPMHVESVAWITERKDVLFSVFFLLSGICYYYFSVLRKQRWLLYLFSLVLFFLSLMAKSAAAPLPLILLLIDYYRDHKISYRSLINKLPFLFIAIWWGSVTVGATKSLSTGETFTAFERLLFAAYNLLVYLYKSILPIKQSVFYPFPKPVNGQLPVIFYISPAILALLIFLVIKYFRKDRRVVFGLLFFFFMIALVLQFIPVGPNITAERYTYLPYIGLFYIMGESYSYIHNLKGNKYKNARSVIQFALIIYIGFLSYKTYKRTQVWKNSETLWANVIKNHPNVDIAYNNMGNYLKSEKRYQDAAKAYKKAIDLNPEYDKAYNNLGNLFKGLGKYEQAEKYYRKTLALDSSFIMAHNNLGVVLYHSGKYQAAEKQYKKAIELDPGFVEGYNNLGNLLSDTKRYEEAEKAYKKALNIYPQFAEGYNNLGALLISQKKYKEAEKIIRKAIQLNPAYTEAYNNLAVALANQKRLKEAEKALIRAVKINPNNKNAVVNLKKIRAMINKRK